MNPDKDEGGDLDPQRGTPCNRGKRTQRPRNSPLLNNNNNQSLQTNYHRDNIVPQQQIPPQNFHQRLPQHIHHWCSENPRPPKPSPQQWQYFTRYRPFGDSVRPYQFPPPPRFPQQFQFGTFPGRNSPRFRHRRENIAVRGANSISSNSNNDSQFEGNLYNNISDAPQDRDVRQKTGPFMNGRKRPNKNRRHRHDSSKSGKSRKDENEIKETGLAYTSVSENNFGKSLCGVSDSMKENLFSVEDDAIKISLSCDESWLNVAAVENSYATVAEEIDSETVEEGAVGGAPLNTNPTTVHGGSDYSPLIDKDLIDEGAIFDLDRIFQNHEISGKSDTRFVNGLSSDDDLDYMFDYETKQSEETRLSDTESEPFYQGRKLCSSVLDSAETWNSGNKGYGCRRLKVNSFVFNGNDRNDNQFHGDGTDSSDSNSNVNASNERQVVEDSDGGEDTGDFIDTDLPSHVKHILSSSDEMDNQSSAKESDDDDDGDNVGRKKCEERTFSTMKETEKNHSDFNSNDLSTLEPHLLNSLSHLNLKMTQNKDILNDKSNQHNGDVENYCDIKENSMLSIDGSSNTERSSKLVSRCSCGNRTNSQTGCRRAYLNSPPGCNYNIRSDALSLTVYGAAADNLCFANHPGADCELPSSSDHCEYSRSINNMCSSFNSLCRHHCEAVAEHSELSASSGRPPSKSCPDCRASGTSTAEEDAGSGSGIFSYNPAGLENSVGSACPHQMNNHHHGHEVNGFVQDQVSHILSNSNSPDNYEATVSASAAERELQDEDSDISKKYMVSNMDSSSSSSSMAGGMEDLMLNFDCNGDHVDMVLLPMEEEIEPVLYTSGGGGDVDDDYDYDEVLIPPNLSRGLRRSQPVSTTVAANIQHHPMMGPSCNFDECHGPHIRDPISVGNRLPSKEFYELIKTVSSTNSYMRFFDKDGQDVQRSTQKTSNDEETTSTTKGNCKQVKRSSGSRGDGLKVDRVMIWNEYEAYVVQYKQIAVSACGQTAVLNVLKALKFQCEKSSVCKVIKTNLRKEDKDIPEYLFSRTCAGTTAVELISGMEKLTGGVIGGRFFHFWPPRKVKLLQWLAYWMKRGAIPMATLNLQQGPHSIWEVPDSWHHQMVYGVSHQGLYLTNPLEIVSERSAVKQLHSDSVLLVRRQDIVSRFRESTDLGQLLDHPDPRWMSMNVLGQVVNVLRECNMPSVPGYRLQVTSHVRIPASYQAGITLFMRKDQLAWNALVTASELPLE